MKLHTLTALLLVTAGLARATITGLNTDPGGAGWNRGDANSGYAQWDSFPSFTFADAAPTASFGITTPELDQSSAMGNPMFGSGLYNVLTSQPVAADGDVLFQGNSTLSFTLTGSTTFAITQLTLQVKRASNAGGLAANFAPTISINGGTAIAFNSVNTTSGTGDTSSDAPGNYSVTTWTWDASLASNATSGAFSISIPSVGNITRGVDFVAADFHGVTPVPEPGTYAIAAALLAVVGFRTLRNRRKTA